MPSYYYYYLDKNMPLLFYAIYSQDAPCVILIQTPKFSGYEPFFENSGYELNVLY